MNWNSLADRALDGEPPTRDECLAIARSPDDLMLVGCAQDLDALLARRQKNSRATGFLLG